MRAANAQPEIFGNGKPEYKVCIVQFWVLKVSDLASSITLIPKRLTCGCTR